MTNETVIIFTIYLSTKITPHSQLGLLAEASLLLFEGLLDFHYLEQAQRGGYHFLAVMACGTMLLGHQIIHLSLIYYSCRLHAESAEALPSLVARIGSASDVKVFATTHVEAILAS